MFVSTGMLDPRLQDGSGHPRRNLNTIVHILHDLLNAQPAARRTAQLRQRASATPTPKPQPAKTQNVAEQAAMRDKVGY